MLLEPDIIIITETHFVGRCTYKLKNYQVIQRNRKTKLGGIMIAVSETSGIDYTVTKIEQDHEMMWIKCTTKNLAFRIAAVYGMQESQVTEEQIESWFYQLEMEYATCSEEPVLLVGDFNAHVGNDSEGIKQNTSKINANGRRVRDFIERRNLTLLNNTDVCEGLWTRVGKDSKSAIDLAICNQDMVTKVKTMKIDEKREYVLTRMTKKDGKYTEVQSDHNSIVIDIAGDKVKNNPKVTMWNVSNEADQRRFSKLTEDICMKEKWLSKGDISTKYRKWYNQIISVMHKCFKKSTIKPGQSNKIIRDLCKVKRQIKDNLIHLDKAGLVNGVAYRFLEEKYQSQVQRIAEEHVKEKEQKIKNRLDRIIEQGSDRRNEIWKVRKEAIKSKDVKLAIKSQAGKLLTEKVDIEERYIQYYKDLLKPRDPNPENSEIIEEISRTFNICLENRSYDNDEINDKFTMDELESVLRKIKPRKCPGPDQIPSEILIHAGTNLKINILNMLNYFWENEEIPDMLHKIDIKTMYKGKGNTEDLKNQRGLFLSNEISKLYEKMMDLRSKPRIESNISQWQAGGRPKRSIVDQLFILRAVMNNCKYMNLKVVIEFLDLVKAFDKMELKSVMLDLWRSEVRGKVWRNIYHINSKSTLAVKTAFGKTKEFDIGEGLKQGSVLATSLAALHTDSVTTLFQQKALSIKYGNLKIDNLLFQDDILRIQKNTKDMNNANQVYKVFESNNRLKFHEEKSVWMSNCNQDEKVKLNNKDLVRTKEYKYLGDIITPDNTYDRMIEARRAAVRGVTAELCAILYNSITIETMKAIKTYFQAVVIPKLLFNSEAWSNLNAKCLQQLEIAQNISIKKLIGLPITSPSALVRSELGLWSVKNQIAMKRLTYLQRVLKMKNNVTRSILMEQQNIPGPTWLKEVMQIMENLNIEKSLNDISTMTKFQWKKIIKERLIKAEILQNQREREDLTKGSALAPTTMCMKKYLVHMKHNEALTILKIRTGMTDTRANYKNSHDCIICPICKREDETTSHMMRCEEYTTEAVPEKMMGVIWGSGDTPEDISILSAIAKTVIARLSERDLVTSDCESESVSEIENMNGAR